MRIEIARSISEAFHVAKQMVADMDPRDPEYCWFRGCKCRTYTLQPGAYWRHSFDEHAVMLQFAHEGGMFASVDGMNDWQTLYLAQHHGIPTRLLDWTESFSASLFFAFDGWDGKSTPCIWICRPQQLNRITLNWEGIRTPENNPELNVWSPQGIREHSCEKSPDGDCECDNDLPIAIYLRRLENRLHSQQGMFTVHGRRRESLLDLVSGLGEDPGNVFSRVDLEGFTPDEIKRDLRMLGIRRSTIYPDISNFVADMRDYYEW